MDEQDDTSFIDDFKRGYAAGGGRIPTAQEEKIYRFFDAIDGLKEIELPANVQWLWNHLASK